MSFLQRYWLSWLLWSALTVTAVAQSPLVDTSEIDARPAAIEKVAVYVIPIEGMIGKPNLYILRRGLKEAIRNDIEMVILDMDTPGGRVDVCLEMMEALDRFDGITATYVNEDAISAGSFIAASTESIYFAPRGKIGASAVIQGTGEDVPETARLKMESYLRANIRVMAAEERYRADVIRAMLDADFELKVGETVIKPAGELLTLTAPEAMQEYGEPPEPLLGAGIYPDLEALLVAKFGAGHYEIKDFQITYSEEWAKWLNTFAPALMGIGMLLLFLEFKTPGFGIFGIGGITLIAIFFISQYIAGLAGNEPILFFILGVLLILAEILFFAGTIVFAASGLLLMAGSLLWAMVDFWPGGKTELSAELFLGPMVNLIFGLALAMGGALLLSRVLKGSWMERQLVLDEVAGGPAATGSAAKPALLGHLGRVVTPLHPAGRVEIDGVRYEASCAVGSIDLGATVRVVGASDFGWIVEEVTDPC